MNPLLPLLAAILQAGSFTLDKVVLSFRRTGFKTYVGISFPLIFFITLIIFLIFRPPFVWELLIGKLGYLLFLTVAMSITTNLLYYRALDEDKLGEIQSFDLLNSIPIIIFAVIIFSDERNFFVIIPALVASFAIIWSHYERHHFRVAKHTLPLVLWSLAAAPVGASISKTLLTEWNPISLELVRSGLIAAMLGPLFWRQAKHASLRVFVFLLATNILTTVAWILFYFSYQQSGIVYTILIFSLQPLLVYLASLFLLKERFSHKKIAAFFIVLASIVIAQIIS